LTRCLKTANLTFSDLALPEQYPFVPTIKELLREGISTHTCDRRSNRTHIENLFPSFEFELKFPEDDPFWSGVVAETSAAQDSRSKRVLDDLFAHDANTWLSITSHSGEIRSLLRVLGHREFSLGTGAVIPVLVEAKWEASNPSSSSSTLTAPAFTSTSFCTNGPQITSVASGCVCSERSSSAVIATAAPTAPTAY
jgi:broad specificity phosphatase PhoE